MFEVDLAAYRRIGRRKRRPRGLKKDVILKKLTKAFILKDFWLFSVDGAELCGLAC